MKRVIVESPYAADTDEGIMMNEIYGELCLNDCLVNHNESPFASHLLYTRKFVLRDKVPGERKLGIEAGFCWRDVTDHTVFYTDLGMTNGMKLGIDDCEEKGKSYSIRQLPPETWRWFVSICDAEAIYIPDEIRERKAA